MAFYSAKLCASCKTCLTRVARIVSTSAALVSRCLFPPLPSQPLAEGEQRKWEDWEYSYVPLMTSAFVIYGVAFYFRCERRPGPPRSPAALVARAANPAPPRIISPSPLRSHLCPPRPRLAHRPKGSAQDVAREEAMRRMAAATEEEEE